jgi:RNA polymerase sigma-54 factor
MLKNVQSLALQQKLSPQLIQAQLLLAVPTLALEQKIKLEIEQNPLLEDVMDTDLEDNTDDEETTEAANEKEPVSETEDGSENGTGAEENTYDMDEWNDYSENDTDGYKSPEEYQKNYKGDSADKTDYLINKYNQVKESPLDQLHEAGLDERNIIIGEEILGSLAEDGYLRDSLDEIKDDLNRQFGLRCTAEEVEKVLKIIQKFDPVGLGSRNLQECMSLQIEELSIDEKDKALCLKLINEHFDEFKAKHFEKLSRILQIPLEKLDCLFEIIHRLNPVPGNMDSNPERGYIYPDFIITKVKEQLVVELTDDYIPPVRINRRYVQMLRSKSTAKQTKEFLKNRFEAAKWFINAIQSRKETMLKVMRAIVSRQREFFLTNGEILKPMFEKDIAYDINMDLSTISRTVRNKYVQTDFGIFELRYFFSNSIQMESGEDVSSKLVKGKIREFIDNENKASPYSDDKLTQLMNEAGFTIARRTVAKYREAMKIPKASLRRKIVFE